MMVLYSGTTCPYSHRCRFVLFEKGMDFEIRDVDLYAKPEDIARARKLEKAYAEAEAAGLGAINVDGIMVDVASIRILRNTILNKADLYGL